MIMCACARETEPDSDCVQSHTMSDYNNCVMKGVSEELLRAACECQAGIKAVQRSRCHSVLSCTFTEAK